MDKNIKSKSMSNSDVGKNASLWVEDARCSCTLLRRNDKIDLSELFYQFMSVNQEGL